MIELHNPVHPVHYTSELPATRHHTDFSDDFRTFPAGLSGVKKEGGDKNVACTMGVQSGRGVV